MSEHISSFADVKRRLLVIALVTMMLSVPIAAFSISLASGAVSAPSSAPYYQGFETGPANDPMITNNWGSNGWGYKASQKHSGSLSIGAAIDTKGDDTRRLFVNVNFSGKSCTSISYYYRITSVDTHSRLMRLIGSNNGGNTWFVLRDWTDITNVTSWTQFSANQNLSNFYNQSNCYIKIQAKVIGFPSGVRPNQRTLYIDDFQIGIGGTDSLYYGSPSVFNPEGDGTGWSCIAPLDSSHAIIAYNDYDGSEGHFELATTCSVNNITYGTKYTFDTNVTFISATRIDSTRVLITYCGSDRGKAFVVKFSGGNITWGPAVTFTSTATEYTSATTLYQNKILIVDDEYVSGSWKGAARVFAISDIYIANVGAPTMFGTGYLEDLCATALCYSKVVVAYTYASQGYARVFTLDGANITNVGSETWFAHTDLISVTALDSSRALIAYSNKDASPDGYARVANVSGTTINLGQPYGYGDYATCIRATAFGPTRALIIYRDGWGRIATVSGDTIGYEPRVGFAGNTFYLWCATLDCKHAIISYQDPNNGKLGTAVVAAI
jgi:hypothetical protein